MVLTYEEHAETKRDQVTRENRAIERMHNIKPEDLPRDADIRKLVEAERRREKKHLKSKPPSDQETLF